MNKNVMQREEVSEEFKWKLEHMYSTNDLWEIDCKKVKELASQLQRYKGRLTESADLLCQGLRLDLDLSRLFDKIYVYAHMRSHENSADCYYQGFADRADSLGTEVSISNVFIISEILEIDEEILKAYIRDNDNLMVYKSYFVDLLRSKAHILTAKEEELLALADELAQAPQNIYNMLSNADIRFPFIKDEKGRDIELTEGKYSRLSESTERRVRKDAFEALYSTYDKQKNTFAATLNASVKANISNAKARKYSSAREAALFTDNVSIEVYDNLINEIHGNMGLMHRYISLRKKMLSLDEFHMYDLRAPIDREIEINISYKEAIETVSKGLKVLGEEYSDKLAKGFKSGWIDVYENRGKQSGAYSWGCYDSHPYVLLNYNDNLNSIFTLAHEMGHALHSSYSNAEQPYIYANYKIFAAEVASILNEALLMDYMLKNTEDKAKKLHLTCYYMEQFRTTMFRQAMFAEFEKIIHERVEHGEPLTSENLCNIYGELNVKYHGLEIIADDYIRLEWARISHFYSNFYVYKYAIGFSAATSLAQQIIHEGQPAVDRYIGFLKSGGSDYPIELLKKAGVDMTSAKPISEALGVFRELLKEMEALIKS